MHEAFHAGPGKVARQRGTAMKKSALAMLAACLAVMAGCANYEPPKAWEKGNLAKPEMTMGGDALEQRFEQHIYTSKENASGGYGVGGGGCGCN
jgi:hypothetical protein